MCSLLGLKVTNQGHHPGWREGRVPAGGGPVPRLAKEGLLPWASPFDPHTSPSRQLPPSLSQIDAASLIAASVMAAPCALALSKLVYPEVEESKFKSEEGVKLSSG